MDKRLYFIVLLFSPFGFIYSQQASVLLNKGNHYFSLENPTDISDKKALYYFDLLISKKPKDKTEALIWTEAYTKKGVLEASFGSEEKALEAYKQSVTLVEQYHLSDSLKIAPYLYMSSLFYYQYNYVKCYEYLKKAETISMLFPENPEASRLYNTLGILYFESADYRQSVNYFKKAIQKRSKEDLGYSLPNNLGQALFHLSEIDSALVVFHDLYQKFPQEESVKLNLASVLLEKKELKASESILHSIRVKSPEKLKLLAEIAFENLKYTEAELILQEGLTYIEEGSKTELQVEMYLILGEIAHVKKKWKTALDWFQKAIILINDSFNDEHISQNPKEFNGSYVSSLTLKSLVYKANCLNQLARLSAHKSVLDAAIATYEKTIEVGDILALRYQNEASRLDLAAKVNSNFQDYTELLLWANKINKAFEISDAGKAKVLRLSLAEQEFKQNHIPQKLIDSEFSLLLAQSALFKQLQDKSEVNLKTQLMDIQLKLAHTRRDMEPFLRKAPRATLRKLKDMQRIITREEVILSFFEGKNVQGLFLIEKDKSLFFPIQNFEYAASLIWELKGKLEKQSAIIEKKYYHEIYYLLFAKIEKHIQSKKHLIIISDNKTHGFPFELLRYRDHCSMIEKWAFSYLFSASFLQKNEKDKGDKVMALAPFALKNAKWGDLYLPNSRNEVNQIKHKELFTDSQATKENFLAEQHRFSTIHLATHAFSDSNAENSYIQFYPKNDTLSHNRLYLHELYPNSIAASLVFLSACQSYGSANIPGEGILGLSWAFYRAGAKGIISSLWNAEDFSTTQISNSFYQYKSRGFSTPVALQKAKLEFIRNPKAARFYSPTFWSHLVYIGYTPYHEPFFTLRSCLLIMMLLVPLYFFKERIFSWIKKTLPTNLL